MAGVFASSPLSSALSYGNSKFLKHQANIAQIKLLQSENGFESWVGPAVSHSGETTSGASRSLWDLSTEQGPAACPRF